MIATPQKQGITRSPAPEPAIPYVDAQPRTSQVGGHRAARYPGTRHRHRGAGGRALRAVPEAPLGPMVIIASRQAPGPGRWLRRIARRSPGRRRAVRGGTAGGELAVDDDPSSTASAPARRRSVHRLGQEVSRWPRATSASMSVHGPWQIAAAGLPAAASALTKPAASGSIRPPSGLTVPPGSSGASWSSTGASATRWPGTFPPRSGRTAGPGSRRNGSIAGHWRRPHRAALPAAARARSARPHRWPGSRPSCPSDRQPSLLLCLSA